MSATWTYDPDTNAGTVRLLITDTAVTAPDIRIYSDQEIARFLALEVDSILNAAALALETIAASEVLIQKRIKLLDLSTDGPAEAAELRALAASYRERADATEEDELPDFAELVVNKATAIARLENEALRAQ